MKYYEPHYTSYILPLFTVNLGPMSTGATSISLNNIYKEQYILGDEYEELQQIMKEIEDKQEFMKLKREEESLQLEYEYKQFMHS